MFSDQDPPTMRESIRVELQKLGDFLLNEADDISPQQMRRLSQVAELATRPGKPDYLCLLRKISSAFNRLLLELIQAHYNTRQREQDLFRLINEKQCTIIDPELTDLVINALSKLYNAAGQCSDTSFERNVLIKYLIKELGLNEEKKRYIERIVQTLLWCNCFQVTQKIDSPSCYNLKQNLHKAEELRCQHDIEIIRKARDKQDNYIRLPPDSWAYLLHGRCGNKQRSRMQSFLDKYQPPPTVDELKRTISVVGDKFDIASYLDQLESVQVDLQHLRSAMSRQTAIEETAIGDLLSKFMSLSQLFTLRQCRKYVTYSINNGG